MVNSVTLVLLLAAVALVKQVTEAATYMVGDNHGWVVPAGGAATYATWAAQHTYAPGDTLVFNFTAGVHDVARVTKAAFDSCTSTNPISLQTIPPVNVALGPAGEYYFICTFATHCPAGQKLAINVTGSTSPPAASPPAPTTPPATTPTAPPPTPNPAPTAPPPTPTTPSPMVPPPSAATPPPTTPAPAPTTPSASPAPHGNAPAPVPTTPAPVVPAPSPMTPPSASPAPHGNAPAPGPTSPAGGGPTSPPPPMASPPPPGSPASPPGESAPPPPAPSSATRKAVVAFAITFMLIVMSVVG